jgi:hypothetical protein
LASDAIVPVPFVWNWMLTNLLSLPSAVVGEPGLLVPVAQGVLGLGLGFGRVRLHPAGLHRVPVLLDLVAQVLGLRDLHEVVGGGGGQHADLLVAVEEGREDEPVEAEQADGRADADRDVAFSFG